MQISAGDLSSDAAKLEKQLSVIFELADHWNALLLLDEADVFLRKRDTDHTHNSLVSVFLRKLEYYQGIMLLTTNRVRDFDDAIQSRIHLALRCIMNCGRCIGSGVCSYNTVEQESTVQSHPMQSHPQTRLTKPLSRT